MKFLQKISLRNDLIFDSDKLALTSIHLASVMIQSYEFLNCVLLSKIVHVNQAKYFHESFQLLLPRFEETELFLLKPKL